LLELGGRVKQLPGKHFIKQNPFNFPACIRRARRKGVTDTGAYCGTVDRRVNPENAPDLVAVIQFALSAGQPLWVRTQAGAWGIREIKLSSDKRQALVKMGRQKNWVWLTGGQLENLAAQAGHKQNPSLRERASELYKDAKHLVTKSSASKAALKRLREAEHKTGVRPTKFGLGAKRNPEDASAAVYEMFHGRPSTQVVEVQYEQHEHENLAALGALVQLKVKTIYGVDAIINVAESRSPKVLPDVSELPLDQRVLLCCNEDKNQLYFLGGDQSVDWHALGLKDEDYRDSMILGVLYELTYQSRKSIEKFQKVNFYHKLGEETGVEPVLLYDPLSELLSVSGGQYRVEDVGICN
jgi:hypothetical protein